MAKFLRQIKGKKQEAFRRFQRDTESKSGRKPIAKKASTSEQKVRKIRRKSRKLYSGEEKIRIGLDAPRERFLQTFARRPHSGVSIF